MKKLTDFVANAVKNSPNGITSIDLLESLKLCDSNTLKTTLSRLVKSGKLLRLKKGIYSINPIINVFVAAQSTFEGYIGFSSALYLHKLTAEMPFSITVVTTYTSGKKTFGQYIFRAVSLKDKATGFEEQDGIILSTRAKTLFDCLYLQKYSIEESKLIEAFISKPLDRLEKKEFKYYLTLINSSRKIKNFEKLEEKIFKNDKNGT